jgi:hypothetical protein
MMGFQLKRSLKGAVQLSCMLVIFQGPILKSNLEKGFESLQTNRYDDAYDYFQKSRKNSTCLSSYGLSLIFADKQSGRYSLDSSYVMINQALVHWPAMGSRESAVGLKFKISKQSIESHLSTVELAAYSAAIDSNSVVALDRFVEFYLGSHLVSEAIKARDSIAFSAAYKSGTAADMLTFINKYPGSVSYTKAKSIYQQLLYNESVSDGSLSSYEVFIRSFPKSPHVMEAWRNVFRITTQNSVLSKPYYDFIRNYPGSPLEEEAWFRVREFYLKENPAAGDLQFKAAFPEFPDSLVQHLSVSDDHAYLLPFFQAGMFGYMDSSGLIVVEPVYESAFMFHEGLGRVRLNGKYGFLNSKGNLVISNYHQEATDFSSGFSVVSENNVMGAIDKRGNTVVPIAYDSISIADENMFVYYSKGLCGYVTRDGFQVTQARFLECGVFRNGVSVFRDSSGYGLTDNTGKVLMNGFSELRFLGDDRYAAINDNGAALYDNKGNALTKHVFDGLGSFSEGLSAASVDGKLGFLDTAGKTRIPFIFRQRDGFPENSSMSGGLVPVSLVEAVGVADSQGNILIADAFENVVLVGSGAAAVYENDVCRMMHVTKERFLSEQEFDSTSVMAYGYLPVKNDIGWGLMDSTWKIVVGFQYDQIMSLSPNYHLVQQGDKFGVINSSGEIIVDILYDSADLYAGRFIALGFVGKLEWFDMESGKILIPQKK